MTTPHAVTIGKKRALLLGVGDYEDNYNFTDDLVIDNLKLFSDYIRMFFEFDKVVIAEDAANNNSHGYLSKNAAFTALQTTISENNDDDLLLLYIACYSPDGSAGTLVFSNNGDNKITDNMLGDMLKGAKGYIWLIIDCNYADVFYKNIDINTMITAGQLALLTSCGDTDIQGRRKPLYPYMTAALINAIKYTYFNRSFSMPNTVGCVANCVAVNIRKITIHTYKSCAHFISVFDGIDMAPPPSGYASADYISLLENISGQLLDSEKITILI